MAKYSDEYKRGYIDAQHPCPSCPSWYDDEQDKEWMAGYMYRKQYEERQLKKKGEFQWAE